MRLRQKKKLEKIVSKILKSIEKRLKNYERNEKIIKMRRLKI
jgi:hypothetical protein